MFVVVARYRAADDATAESVESALREVTPLTRGEAGCLEFFAHRDTQDEHAFLLYERYRDRDAFDAHCRSPHYESIVRDRIRPMLASREIEFPAPIEPAA